MKEKTTIAKRLQLLRKEKGLTQYQMAELLNVSRVQYSYYENGTSTPTLETLTTMANMFQTSIDYIVGNTNTKEKKTINDLMTINDGIINNLECKTRVIVSGRVIDDKLTADLLNCYKMARTLMEIWAK